MSAPHGMPWSNNPNYSWQWSFPQGNHTRKTIFFGDFIGAMFLGISTVLFFQCMFALFNPANCTRRVVKWGLVAHTTAMFSLFAAPITVYIKQQSFFYIDFREYLGGPSDENIIFPEAIFLCIMFPPSQWLADGLLLYRCYVIYSSNAWVIAFPCLLYIASVAMGVVYLYENWRPSYNFFVDGNPFDLILDYFLVSFFINILLTLMIAMRLVVRSTKIRNALGTATGVYKAIVTILVESSILYTAAFLLYIATWAAYDDLLFVSASILGGAQVIAPLLITIRIANRRALTSAMVTSGNLSSIRFRSQGRSTYDSGTLPGGNLVSSMGTIGEAPGVLSIGTETVIEGTPR